MPELPDVEAIRRYLVAVGLPGRTITAVRLDWPKAIQEPAPEEFARRIRGHRIQDIGRRAKFLLFALSSASHKEGSGNLGSPTGVSGGVPLNFQSPSPSRERGTQGMRVYLILHLRMTGSLLVEPASQEPPKHTHIAFTLDDGRELRFADPRKLGMIWLVEDPGPVLSGLGPEPLEPGFTPQVLRERLDGRRAPVKALLCDQSLVAGIGNIYADEVLFEARIHPLKIASQLSDQEVHRLHQAMVTVLPRAIQRLAAVVPVAGPPTESEQGLSTLVVPRREGARCPRCGTSIQRVVVRGRSAYFCPSCQQGGATGVGVAIGGG